MPGTLVQDALAPALHTGATLNSAGTTTGTAADIKAPRHVRVQLVSATASGTNPTLDVEIQSSDDSNFGSFSTLAKFTQTTTASLTKYVQAYCPHRYVRAKVVLGGTSPSFASSTIKVVEPHFRRQPSDTA